jgi:hypothetical protein
MQHVWKTEHIAKHGSISVIPAFQKPRLEDHQLEASLGYRETLSRKKGERREEKTPK